MLFLFVFWREGIGAVLYTKIYGYRIWGKGFWVLDRDWDRDQDAILCVFCDGGAQSCSAPAVALV